MFCQRNLPFQGLGIVAEILKQQALGGVRYSRPRTVLSLEGARKIRQGRNLHKTTPASLAMSQTHEKSLRPYISRCATVSIVYTFFLSTGCAIFVFQLVVTTTMIIGSFIAACIT